IVRARAAAISPPTPARAPFVLVVDTTLVPADRTIPLTSLPAPLTSLPATSQRPSKRTRTKRIPTEPGRRAGFADFDPEDLREFCPIAGLAVPPDPIYVVDRKSTRLNSSHVQTS